MNESSSRFVDQFATEKLLQEKLSRVHHSPQNSLFKEEESFFADFKHMLFNPTSAEVTQEDPSHKVLKVPSSIRTEPYPENNTIYLHYYPTTKARGNILLVHGLFDDNIINYHFLFQLLKEAGFNIFFFVLPYHYERKPATSLFSGEFYWSADLFRSQHAAKQGIYDLKTAVRTVKYFAHLPTVLAGFSMGGNLSLRYFLLEDIIEGLFLINPVTRLSQLIWESPLLSSVQKDLEVVGYDLRHAEKFFTVLDPVKNITDIKVTEKIALGYSIYDQIIGEAKYLELIEKFRFESVIAYNAGHLNILRVPKLAGDIADYFNRIAHRKIQYECEG